MDKGQFIMEIIVSIVAVVSFVISCVCVAICTGMARATHSVQYVEYDPFKDASPELKEELMELKKSNDEIINRSIGRIKADGKESKKIPVMQSLDAELGIDEI